MKKKLVGTLVLILSLNSLSFAKDEPEEKEMNGTDRQMASQGYEEQGDESHESHE